MHNKFLYKLIIMAKRIRAQYWSRKNHICLPAICYLLLYILQKITVHRTTKECLNGWISVSIGLGAFPSSCPRPRIDSIPRLQTRLLSTGTYVQIGTRDVAYDRKWHRRLLLENSLKRNIRKCSANILIKLNARSRMLRGRFSKFLFLFENWRWDWQMRIWFLLFLYFIYKRRKISFKDLFDRTWQSITAVEILFFFLYI